MRLERAFVSLYVITASGFAINLRSASPQSGVCRQIVDTLNDTATHDDAAPLIVNGQLAHDCLMSLPFEPVLARQFLTELRKYIHFQSTIEALKDPPDTCLSPPVDILGGLDQIEKNDYQSQYQFDLDLFELFSAAHDGHFYTLLCSLGIFQFSLQAHGLVSVSRDGVALPEIYMNDDLEHLLSFGTNVSPVTRINNQEAFAYLENRTARIPSHDPDARWNQLFASKAMAASGNGNLAHGAFITNSDVWPGVNSTVIEFLNGTIIEIPTVARVWSKILEPTGDGVFNTFCRQPAASLRNENNNLSRVRAISANDARSPYEAESFGYPEPFLRDSYGQINGFLLDEDTTVMHISSFQSIGLPENQGAVMHRVASQIVAHALASGRTKLIIDVSANFGGQVIRAYDLFRLFFPNKFPYSATRFRRSNATETMVKVLGTFGKAVDDEGGPFDYREQVTAYQDKSFDTVDSFLGDETQLGVGVSSLYAQFNFSLVSTDDTPIRGYGSASETLSASAPFKPEDILIVGDGSCASTCTTFVNLMTNVGGVRTLAFGGRPRAGPMQIMGGVRGAESFSYEDISAHVNAVNQLLSQKSSPNDEYYKQVREEITAYMPIPIEDFPLQLRGGGVNFRNAYQQGDDELPLQFAYQESNCRLFYTAENVKNPATTWLSAKHAIWGDGKCVDGSSTVKGPSGPDNSQSQTKDGQEDDFVCEENSTSVQFTPSEIHKNKYIFFISPYIERLDNQIGMLVSLQFMVVTLMVYLLHKRLRSRVILEASR